MTLQKPAFSFCLCADDYAMTPAVSRGILEALEARALSATSVMTNSPWWPESATALEPFWSQASIGLHLNLTLGAPLGPCPKLAPGGRFPAIGTYMNAGRPLPLDEIEAELGRQIEAFIALTGRLPTHVDGHQHVHLLGPVRPLVLRQLGARGLAGKAWLRDSTDQVWRILARRQSLKKALGLSALGRGFAAHASRAGFAVNDGFAGFSTFRPEADYSRQFARYLVSPGPRHLVMCHPGYVDDVLRKLDPVTESRENELAFLLSSSFRASLEAEGASLSPLFEPSPGSGA